MADETQRRSRLIALVFDALYKADEARAALQRISGEEKLLKLGGRELSEALKQA